MSDFVPLFNESAAPAQAGVFSALAVTPATASSPASATDSTAAVRQPAADAITPDTCTEAPLVTLVRDNDQVVRIVVQCACGRKIELDCVY